MFDIRPFRRYFTGKMWFLKINKNTKLGKGDDPGPTLIDTALQAETPVYCTQKCQCLEGSVLVIFS